MPNERLPARGLLAVYPDREAADAAARTLEGAGVARSALRIDDPADEVRSLDAEVREEMSNAVSSPTVGMAYPKEAAKSLSVVLPVLVAVGAVIGAVVASPISIGDSSFGVRLLVGAVVGATMGAAISVVVAPAMGVANPQDPSPAETGSTLFVGDARAAVVEALAATGPIRLDRIADGAGVDTLVTEADTEPGGTVEDLAASFARERAADPEDRTR